MQKKLINDFLEEYKWIVVFVINRFFPSQRNNDDMMQIGLIELWKIYEFIDETREEREVVSYMITCVRNRMNDEYRKQMRVKRFIDTESIQLDDEITDKVGEMDDGFDKIFIKDFASKQEKTERKIVELSSKGYNLREIAKEVNLSETAVWKKKRKLKEKFMS